MNLHGSFRKLLGNSISAMSAAIEIYNKPNFNYRDETFVILLINAWELALKALLSKNKTRIFYEKKRNEPYRAFTIKDVIIKCESFFPSSIDYRAVRANLEKLIIYRNNTIHFYNDESIRVTLYSLAQTSIVNYNDLLREKLDKKLSNEIVITLLPLSISAPIDPIKFLNISPGTSERSPAHREFNDNLKELVKDIEDDGGDTGRLLTVFNVSLQSTKKIASSDFVVGVKGEKKSSEQLLVKQTLDPNKSHPLFRKDIICVMSKNTKGLVQKVGGVILTSTVFEKIAERYKIKENIKYCWRADDSTVIKYSYELVNFLKSLSPDDIKDVTK